MARPRNRPGYQQVVVNSYRVPGELECNETNRGDVPEYDEESIGKLLSKHPLTVFILTHPSQLKHMKELPRW